MHTRLPGGTPPFGPGPAKVTLPAFTRSLPMTLLRAREAVMRPFRASLRRHGVTEQQWRVLRALDQSGEVDAAELANATFLLGPSLSRILRDLDRRGLIAKRAVKADLRRARIAIAPAGRALIEEIRPESEAIYAEISARFGLEPLILLQSMLENLERTLTETPARQKAGGSAP
jgi:homoprotocatechuate degradation regulator HpaR